ncbi:MAG TPA: Dyp-type peroxidase [Solirubrobacteraceae bacterium]|jgi:deferrochelatase/peroxidase EfeB|nr:Dyp-type peroxidase [Solirubrobacteraceae bacterium]HXB15425.1 Dyp-type peroxidase [Solirubrobacteraceae bacterium]
MSAPANRLATGILPDSVIRTPDADATLLSVTLSEQLTPETVKAWLTDVTGLVGTLQSTVEEGRRVATVNVAFAASFFQTAPGTGRFGLSAEQIPVELATPPTLPALTGVAPVPGDVLFYILSTSDAAVAAFKAGLSATHPAAVVGDSLEVGFQRHDKREQFGFRDGLRNIPSPERPEVVFLDPERSPEEPAWTAGGSYVAYLKIRQDVAAMEGKSIDEQQQIIGRRKSDGSRLDLPEGTVVAQEGEFTGTACPAAAHIRKAGPRGTLHDGTRIFRRGVPYLTLNPDGSDERGLQFVSYQRSLDEFAAIFGRWMTNPSFPAPGTGTDSLLASGVITIEKAGFFFSPPRDSRFIGAQIFDPPPVDPCGVGRIVVQKELLDQNGQPVLSELGGISFQILQGGQPVGAEFTTDSTGRAVSPPVPRGTALAVHEVSAPVGFQEPADTEITLEKARTLVRIVNHQTPGSEPHYSG